MILLIITFITLLVVFLNKNSSKQKNKNVYNNHLKNLQEKNSTYNNTESIKVINNFISNSTIKENSTSNKIMNQSNNSIEDISNETCSLRPNLSESNTFNSDNYNLKHVLFSYNEPLINQYGVPYWPHKYIYSYSDLDEATPEQKKFYQAFKTDFLNGEYNNLYGNWNYAFILLFDLLNEYEVHKDIQVLEKQLDLLGFHYSRTKSYCISFLIKKLENIGDEENINRIIENNPYDYYGYDYWRLGNRYKNKLKLNDKEVELLNKLYFSPNTFTEIEACLIETLRLYLSLFETLQDTQIEGEKNLEQFITEIADLYIKKFYKYRKGSHNYNYAFEDTIKYFYQNIFKLCENAVREFYGHKRKLNTDFSLHMPEINNLYQEKIVPTITQTLFKLTSIINLPDEATDIKLYTQNTTRWKIKFSEITENYNEDPKQFLNDIISLGKLNENNPSIENIFFDSSKFIAKYDKEIALSLYIYYLYYDLKSSTFNNKPLTKTIQKNLFKTNEQFHDFEIIVEKLIKTRNLDEALSSVSSIYKARRKKINLNKSIIKEVQEQHSETVELLNEYLQDESESLSTKSQDINANEIKIVSKKTIESNKSIYLDGENLSSIQIDVLNFFAKNSLCVSFEDFDIYAKDNNIFKNHLIDSINEIYYEVLDDILIEEEDEFYTILKDYYQKITIK